ncbi:hypothetical protein L2E82_01802 [Cichorium intybus]|uniref:Uncharacterized protein n=1 Tax=Cichorium intybus TaxID=13427 RepID=A0ACB9H102_CICIN|nr:hypothetical protein L2E82_01802 [Cichorium intybus]
MDLGWFSGESTWRLFSLCFDGDYSNLSSFLSLMVNQLGGGHVLNGLSSGIGCGIKPPGCSFKEFAIYGYAWALDDNTLGVDLHLDDLFFSIRWPFSKVLDGDLITLQSAQAST